MQVQVVTFAKQKGVGKKSGVAYDFWRVGALVTTARGVEFAEFMLDGEQPSPEGGKAYHVELEAYPDREKKLVIRVAALRPVDAVKRVA